MIDSEKSDVGLTQLRRSRAVRKRQITMLLKKLDESPESAVSSAIGSIKDLLSNVKSYDEQINDLLASLGDSSEFSEEFDNELESQSSYLIEVNIKMAALEKSVQTYKQKETNFDLKLPNLSCPVFSGEGASHLEFSAFIMQFQNCIGHRITLSPSAKFTYLKTYLRGYALKVLQHLQVNDENYEVALKLLESEFLNRKAVIDDLYQKLLSLKPKPDPTFLETKLFLNEVRCVLSDLKHYKRDLLSNESSAEFVSHLVFHKLPAVVRDEFIIRLDTNYPSLDQILDNYVEIIRKLNLRKDTSTVKPTELKGKAFDLGPVRTLPDEKSVLVNSATGVASKSCKFCGAANH